MKSFPRNKKLGADYNAILDFFINFIAS